MAIAPHDADHDDGNDYNENGCYHGHKQIQISHENFHRILVIATTVHVRYLAGRRNGAWNRKFRRSLNPATIGTGYDAKVSMSRH